MKFSSRVQVSECSKVLIYDDAPKITRIGYYKQILKYFASNSDFHPQSVPLDCYELHEKFCALIRDESDPWHYSEESAWDGLVCHLKQVRWMEFFDFVELVGKELQIKAEDPFQTNKFSYDSYQNRVNALFEEDFIGWRLDDHCELTRNIPQSLLSRFESTKDLIENSFEPAREHYRKSIRYLYQHPIDPANSIKEIVSALESVGRTLYPGSATLGDVIKKIKKLKTHPSQLLDAYEKFYAYANATPSVRHGHTEMTSLSVHDAELMVHTGIALIRYLIDTNESL